MGNLGSWSVVGTCFVAARRKKHSNIAACKYRRLGKDGVGGGAADGPGAASDAWGGWYLHLVPTEMKV